MNKNAPQAVAANAARDTIRYVNDNESQGLDVDEHEDSKDDTLQVVSANKDRIEEAPYTIYTNKERWFIVFMIAFAGMFR